MQNFCGKCGTKLSSELKFCTNCGAPIQNDVELPKEETKNEIESVGEKKFRGTQPAIGQDQSFDPKIKELSILIIVLVCALFVAGFVFNYPIQSSLSFDADDEGDVENFIEVYKEAFYPGNVLNSYFTVIGAMEKMNKLKANAGLYYPLVNLEILWKITLLILILIIISFGANELIKDPNKLKWAIILAILAVGLVYSFIVSNESNGFISSTNDELLFLSLSITFCIFFCTIAFYNNQDYKQWIYTSAIVSLVFAISSGGFNKPEKLEPYLNVQFSTIFFYLFRYLYLSSLIILPSLAFHHFLKSFIYESSSSKVSGSLSEVSSKEEYNKLKDKVFHR